MPTENETRRRRMYFYPGFQPSFVWGLGGAVLAAGLATVFSMVILLLVHGRSIVPDVLPILIGFHIVVELSLLLFVYWVALFVSHRMGGPLYRMEMAFKGMAQGRLDQRVNLRRGDQLQREAEALNQGVGSLRERLEDLRDQVKQLEMVRDPQEARDRASLLGRRMDDLFVF
ncbi:MAG: methyl-accepting chemotaxis protein [Desulfarculaceae bacterium]|nr:methyl-accepting chemotaxis protein [Desulfarculaceae bacterium]